MLVLRPFSGNAPLHAGGMRLQICKRQVLEETLSWCIQKSRPAKGRTAHGCDFGDLNERALAVRTARRLAFGRSREARGAESEEKANS